MSEDNVTALFRATVAQARAEGSESAYRTGASQVADLYREVDSLPLARIKERLNAIRYELEVQANVCHLDANTIKRRIARAGMELRDDTTPR